VRWGRVIYTNTNTNTDHTGELSHYEVTATHEKAAR